MHLKGWALFKVEQDKTKIFGFLVKKNKDQEVHHYQHYLNHEMIGLENWKFGFVLYPP